uniref:3-hydroxyacyl-CoA dehydrogenase n=1 Tax=Setaria italica TaxID=4555 RepID=K3YDX5_SETIT
MYSLMANYEEALRRNDVRAIVLIVEKLKVDFIDAMTDTLEVAEKPLVAAIDGLAFGAGLEFFMACQARISTPTAQLCFQKLRLGVIPGFGGTQRLPRLVRLTKALEMILLSKHIRAEEAHQLGLVDAIVPPEELLSTACRWALDVCESRRPWCREILKFARDQVRKRAPNLKHPLVCIDVIEEGIVSGPRAGLLKEGIAFQKPFFSDTCKSLVHVFFSQRATLKIAGVTDLGLIPRNVKKVAVVGGGLMGSGIATTLILNHYNVILKEANEKLLNAGVDRIKANLQRHVKKGKMTQEECKKTHSLLIGVVGYERFKEADLVFEAVIENVKLKQQVFAELERHCPPHCILATNTWTIDLELIGQDTNCQERIVGAHFFQHTLPQAVIDLLDVVRNCTGFAVNRMFFPYIQQALFLLHHGLELYKIDRACTEFGMPVGPFRLADLVGFGVVLATGTRYLENFPDRVYKSMLVPLMIEDKWTGLGFYMYEGRRKAIPDPDTMKYVEKLRSMAGASTDPELMKLEGKDIVEMVLFPVINEACRVLDDGIAAKASDLDIASIFGMGFPSYRGGIMYWADSTGAKRIHAKLSEWEKKYGHFSRPCSYLPERAAGGVPLSAPTSQAKARL